MSGSGFETPPGEHDDDLPDEHDQSAEDGDQEENAETSLDQPSQ